MKTIGLSLACWGLLLGMSARLSAQQPAQYSMYMLNPMAYHTAYSGLDGSLSSTAVFRKQWVGLPGSPMTFGINAHLPLEYLRSGVGLHVEHDMLGAEANTSIQLGYNYIWDFGKNRKLSFGGAFRVWQKGVDGSKLRAPEGTYEGGTIVHNDGVLPFGKVNGMAMTGDAGLYYKDERLEIGFTARNLSQPVVEFQTDMLQRFRFVRGYFLSASYRIDIADQWVLIPSMLVKSDLRMHQPEVGLMLEYQQRFFFGTGYRGYNAWTQDALSIWAGVQVDKHWKLAYAYDVTLSKLNAYSSGSHELILNYNLAQPLGKEIPAKIIYNPRFL